MINVKGLHKFYHKNKRNEVHVLNEVELTFESKGLVVLLGASGSGKTTLLNVLGGMDKFNQGEITLFDRSIKKYRPHVWDSIRSKSIGMIFQNYYLLPNETVHENIAITLRMIGITDKHEIDNRIQYLLEAVNMARHERRLASQLSGGEQQRIAIARALAKNPNVLLVDEPTGNLDSKNTIGIMNIIKQIAKEKLIIMVTHETQLANYYADRIIEIEDGKIIGDEKNVPNGKLDYTHETDIYLGDLEREKAEGKHINLDLYKEDTEQTMNVRMIVKNHVLYIDVPNSGVHKIVNLKERPDITLYDQSIKDDIEEDVRPFTFDQIIDENIATHKPKNPVTFKNVFAQTTQKLLSATRGQRLLFIGLAIGAMIIAHAVSNIFNIITVRDEDFLTMPRNSIEITEGFYTVADLTSLVENHESISGFRLTRNAAQVELQLPAVHYSRSHYDHYVDALFININEISDADLILGRMPQNPREVVVDQAWAYQTVYNENPFYALGITTNEHLLNLSFVREINGEIVHYAIVGIANTETPVVYAHDAFFTEFHQSGFHVYELYADELELLAGRHPEAANEILLASHRVDESDYATFETFAYTAQNGRTYQAVGVYTLESFTPLHNMLWHEALLTYYFDITQGDATNRYIFAENVDQAMLDLEAAGLEGSHIYTDLRDQYYLDQVSRSMPSLIFSGIVIGASALSFYFVIRSSMIHRIYEIGVYRSLGTKKRHIFKRFILETAIITTFSSLIGFIVMTYILYSAQNAVGDFIRLAHVSMLSILTGLLVIYGINIVSGILPVARLLQKTPAQINSQYDL